MSVTETAPLAQKAEIGVCSVPAPLLVDTITAGSLQLCYALWMRREFVQVMARSSVSLQLGC